MIKHLGKCYLLLLELALVDLSCPGSVDQVNTQNYRDLNITFRGKGSMCYHQEAPFNRKGSMRLL